MVARYRLNVDYTSATAGTDDGHVVFTPNVAVSGSVGTNATIVSPLGTNAIAAAVSVTPATSSSWAVTGTFFQATQPVSGTVAATQSGTWNVVPSAPIGGAYTDRSIANLAGTSETLMASNASRKVLVVYNIGATAIAVNLTGGTASLTVGGSVVLQAGGSLVLDSYPPTSAITIIGTTNADVTAYEG